MARVMASNLQDLQAQYEELTIKHKFLTVLTNDRRVRWQDAKHDLRRTQFRLRKVKAKNFSRTNNDPFRKRLPPREAGSGRFKRKYATEEERRNARLASRRAYWHKCKSRQESSSLPDSTAATSEVPRGIREEPHPQSRDPGLASVSPAPSTSAASAEPENSSPTPAPPTPQDETIQQASSAIDTRSRANIERSACSQKPVAAPVSPVPSTSTGIGQSTRLQRPSKEAAQTPRRRSTRLANKIEFGQSSALSEPAEIETADHVPSQMPGGVLCSNCKLHIFIAPTRDQGQREHNEDASEQRWWTCTWCQGRVEENCLSSQEKRAPFALICKMCVRKLYT